MALVGGSECGPSNGLQTLTKRFDADRGIQQDHFGAGRAGSSRDAFRSQNPTVHDADAARFFAGGRVPPQFSPDAAYDMSAIHASLPKQQTVPMQVNPIQANPMASWAADFMHQTPVKEDMAVHTGSRIPMGLSYTPPTTLGFRANTMPMFMNRMPLQHHQPPSTMSVAAPNLTRGISWDKEFSELERSTVQREETVTQQTSQFESDELARTAGLLLDNVKHEQNPKFQNSQFLGLMKQLRDGEMIVEGNQMVESDGTRSSAQASGIDLKGKGPAIAPTSQRFATPTPMAMLNTVQQQQQQQHQETQMEDPLDAYFRQENQEYTEYWNGSALKAKPTAAAPSAESQFWGKLQSDWDQFEATTSGIKPAVNYRFQENNPYLLGDSSRTRHHLQHTAGRQTVLESVLELEAAVQRNPNDASAWYLLGVKQQENEREHKAIQALEKAVQLDPTHLPSWLALAVSNTNDNNRQGTYDAVHEWVHRNEKYSLAVQEYWASNYERAETLVAKYSQLIQCLIAMARSDTSGEVDADIQIALAVLLNTNEDYVKAQDCFRTALAVRPDDWLLYNRVGATMANSGKAEEALSYYYRALELNPGYIRARFNLGISCINLRRYEEAVHHILDALELQENEGGKAHPDEERGAASQALWESLRTTCLHLQRADLATMCDSKNIQGFREAFFGQE